MKTLRPKLTFANVVSCLALFVALGGSAYAATQLPKNSVGTKQLKNSAVTSAKVKDGSLLSADFEAGQLPAGQTGSKGEKGEPGPSGLSGYVQADAHTAGTGTVSFFASHNSSGEGTQACPTGKRVLGGGVIHNSLPSKVFVTKSGPISENEWQVEVQNTDPKQDASVEIRVVCATVTG